MAKETTPKKRTKRPTAEKRIIQNEKKRLINRNYKSQVRTAIRHFTDSMSKKDRTTAQESLQNVYSLVDKCVKKGIYKLNKASRTKSRLTAQLATLAE